MKLLRALKAFPADNCIILTYNLDLLFFEYMLFQSLYAAGCRNTLVVADPGQYTSALKDAPQLRYAGQRYVVSSGRTSPSGAFHPKLILLTSPEKGAVFLTSGNLTLTGYTHNWEVVTSFEYDSKRPDSVGWQACHWAFQTLQQIVENNDDDLAQQRLDRLWRTTRWLWEPPSPQEEDTGLWLLHNLETALLEQFHARYQETDGSAVSEATIISPYFDVNLRALDALAQRFHPQQWHVYTQDVTSTLSRMALERIFDTDGVSVEIAEVHIKGNRRLHAKSIALRTQKGVWLMTGSANCSAPALLFPARRGNTELVALRYQEGPACFDQWLHVLTDQATPVEISALSTSIDPPDPRQSTQAGLSIVSARLHEGYLYIQISRPISQDIKFTVHLRQKEASVPISGPWKHKSDSQLYIRVDDTQGLDLTQPTLVDLAIGDDAGMGFTSQTILHNQEMLERFGRPLRRKNRPPILPGLTPSDYEHSIQLMEMLQELLATNADALKKHSGPVAIQSARTKEEASLTLEDDYDPETYFVDETIRIHSTETGAEIYADYYDRLTYEEILKAIRAALVPLVPSDTESPHSSASDTVAVATVDKPTASSAPEGQNEERMRKKARARLQSGLTHLIKDFQHSAQDETFLENISPAYVVELFIVLASYLSIVWREGLIGDKFLVDSAMSLLSAFWGELAEPGIWRIINNALSEEDREELIQRWQVVARTWLIVFFVARIQEDGQADKYKLAAWMRYFVRMHTPPETLLALSQADGERLWHFSAPLDWGTWIAEEVVTVLNGLLPQYDEETLLEEIKSWPDTRAKRKYENTAGINRIPALDVTLPLTTQEEIKRCLGAFLIFLNWPRTKKYAWAIFSNTNPAISPTDIKTIRFFYREDERLFWIAKETSLSNGPEIIFEVDDVSQDDLIVLQDDIPFDDSFAQNGENADLRPLRDRRKYE